MSTRRRARFAPTVGLALLICLVVGPVARALEAPASDPASVSPSGASVSGPVPRTAETENSSVEPRPDSSASATRKPASTSPVDCDALSENQRHVVESYLAGEGKLPVELASCLPAAPASPTESSSSPAPTARPEPTGEPSPSTSPTPSAPEPAPPSTSETDPGPSVRPAPRPSSHAPRPEPAPPTSSESAHRPATSGEGYPDSAVEVPAQGYDGSYDPRGRSSADKRARDAYRERAREFSAAESRTRGPDVNVTPDGDPASSPQHAYTSAAGRSTETASTEAEDAQAAAHPAHTRAWIVAVLVSLAVIVSAGAGLALARNRAAEAETGVR